MKTFGKVAMLWFLLSALVTGFAWAGFLDSMQPVTVEVTVDSDNKSPAKRPALQWPEMTREQAFYYWVAVYGAPADLVDRYARVFDADNYRRAMADEFERSRYRDSVEARIMTHVRELTFNETFTYVNRAGFGEYSFTSHAFPLGQPNTGFSYFNYWVAGNGFDINPFDLGMALNTTDFTWSVPMPEAAGSALLKSRPERTLTVRIVYSVTREKNDVHSLRFYLTPFIHTIDVFADDSMTKLVGTLSRDASAPHDPQEWALKQEEAARLLIGTWRDENSVITYSADGTRFAQWDKGTTRKYKWSFSRGIIQGEIIEMDGQPVFNGGAGGFKTRLISITPSTLVTMDSKGKTWHSERVGASPEKASQVIAESGLTEPTSNTTNEGQEFVGTWSVHAVISRPVVDPRTNLVTGKWTETVDPTPLEWSMKIEREGRAFRISGGGREVVARYDGGRLVVDRTDGLTAAVTMIDASSLRWDFPDDLIVLRRRP
jgi:hypothetical protein